MLSLEKSNNLDTYIVKCTHSIVAHKDAVTCLVSQDYTLISGGNDGFIKVWDIRKMQLIQEFKVTLS